MFEINVKFTGNRKDTIYKITDFSGDTRTISLFKAGSAPEQVKYKIIT